MTTAVKNLTLDHAKFYASKGWDVFPITPRRKNPPLVKWGDEATTEPGTISRWWNDSPQANIGIATGARSGIIVLDIDPEHGGEESLMALIVQNGPLPETPESLTGSGGRHIVFRHPGPEIRNSAGKLGPGLDIRGDGGYIVAPPSIHPNGKSYEWEISSRPSKINIAPMPGWLVGLLTTPDEGQYQPADTVTGKIVSGSRNDILASLAGTMRRRGFVYDAILAALLEENRQRCDPPLSADEISAIAKSITRYQPAEPKTMPTPQWPDGEVKVTETYDAYAGVMAFIELLSCLDGRSIPTFIPQIDAATGGLERQTLTVLAARPSMGKSTLAWQIALNASANGLRSLFVSLEMSVTSLWAKVACGAAGVRWRDVRSGAASDDQISIVIDKAIELMKRHEDRILVHDGVNTSETIWLMIEELKPDIVVVDHLRLVSDRHDKEDKRLGIISQRLKDAAKAFNCAVLCLAQLNRGVENRDNKRPAMADLRDSGQIEENADNILMMYRSDYYDDESEYRPIVETELIIRKFRDDIGKQKVVIPFDMKHQWFGGE